MTFKILRFLIFRCCSFYAFELAESLTEYLTNKDLMYLSGLYRNELDKREKSGLLIYREYGDGATRRSRSSKVVS